MMVSIILRTATRFLITLLLLFSLFLLFRGHNEPGGGFAAGLVVAAAFALYAIAYDIQAARSALRVDSRTLVAIGLLLTVASGLHGMVLGGDPFLTGQWGEINLPGFEKISIGTPLIFDIGVYITVIGTVLTIILALQEE